MDNNIKMKDIAESLGISVVTVSKALNDKDGVGDELRQKIKDLAMKMGYNVNRFAKSMKEGFSNSIGIIICDRFLINNDSKSSIYLECYQMLSTELEKKGYTGILYTLSENDEFNLVTPRIYREKVVDGLIFLGQTSNDYIKNIKEKDIPYVLFDFYTTDFESDCIVNDNYLSGFQLGEFILSKGLEDIIFIGNLRATLSIQDRFLGILKAFINKNKYLDVNNVINDRDERGKFISIDIPKKLPQVFVCNCDQVAFRLIQELKNKGIDVPKDCGVVSFDNDIYATLIEPYLTTIDINVTDMSIETVKLIIKKINDTNHRTSKILIKSKLIIRESVL